MISLGRKERAKGTRGEQEVANEFKARGFDVRRVPNSGGLDTKGDLLGLDGFHVEVKRQETLSIPKWLRQAEDEAPAGTIPLIIFRQSNEPWRVVIDLQSFIDLLEDRYDGSYFPS